MYFLVHIRIWASLVALVCCVGINNVHAQNADTISQRINSVTHSLNKSTDSIPALETDSLRIKTQLDSISNRLNTSIDSIANLKLPPEKYFDKLDSLLKSTQATVEKKVMSATDSLNSKANRALRNYQDKLKAKSQRLDSLSRKFDLNADQPDINLQIDHAEFKIPEVGSPEYTRIDIPQSNPVQTEMPALNLDVPAVDNISDKLEELGDATSKAGEYSGKIDNLKKTDFKEEAGKLPGEVESQIVKIDELENLNKELSETDKIVNQVDKLKSEAVKPEEMEGEVKTRSKKVLVDHMAGKDEAINKGLQQMEKYQRKYNTVTDIRKLPEKKPNDMAGKPFLERMIPGIQFQVSNLDVQWKGVDIAPTFEYWFHHRFRAGFGASYRINVNIKSPSTTAGDRVYGFQTMARYKLYKGLFGHMDGEFLRTNTSLLNGPKSGDPNLRVWKKSVNIGIFKTYRINKYTRGTMLFIYDLTTIDETFNVSQIAFRFGIELKLKKKKRDKNQIEANAAPK